MLAAAFADFMQQVVSGFASGGIYAALALALVIIHRSTGVINFSQGEMATLCTYIAWTLTFNHGWSYWPAFAATLAVSGNATLDLTLGDLPDAFGYRCGLESAAFEEAGTVQPITGTSGVAAVAIPFPFTFYGETYNSVYVCANGFVDRAHSPVRDIANDLVRADPLAHS